MTFGQQWVDTRHCAAARGWHTGRRWPSLRRRRIAPVCNGERTGERLALRGACRRSRLRHRRRFEVWPPGGGTVGAGGVWAGGGEEDGIGRHRRRSPASTAKMPGSRPSTARDGRGEIRNTAPPATVTVSCGCTAIPAGSTKRRRSKGRSPIADGTPRSPADGAGVAFPSGRRGRQSCSRPGSQP